MDLILQGVEPQAANRLCGLMRQGLKWRVIPNAPEGSRFWEGKTDDGWILALSDFSIEEQTGRAGERGQNVGISNTRLGIWIGDVEVAEETKRQIAKVVRDHPEMRDKIKVVAVNKLLMHHIARFLVENMKATDQFEGTGKLSMDDEAGSVGRMAEGNLDLRFPADLRRAVQWQEQHCSMLNEGGVWGMTGATLQCYKSRKLVKVIDGDLTEQSMHMAVRIAFLAMGWTIEESRPHPKETAIAERWAKRYTP